MDSNKKNPDILESLFRQMPEEELPASFRLNVCSRLPKRPSRLRNGTNGSGWLLSLWLRWGCWGWLPLSSSTWFSTNNRAENNMARDRPPHL